MGGGGGEGGVFELGNPEGRGAQAVLEIQVEGVGKASKARTFRRGGVDLWILLVLFFKMILSSQTQRKFSNIAEDESYFQAVQCRSYI